MKKNTKECTINYMKLTGGTLICYIVLNIFFSFLYDTFGHVYIIISLRVITIAILLFIEVYAFIKLKRCKKNFFLLGILNERRE